MTLSGECAESRREKTVRCRHGTRKQPADMARLDGEQLFWLTMRIRCTVTLASLHPAAGGRSISTGRSLILK